MPHHACPTCGAVTDQRGGCEAHRRDPNRSWSPNRNRRAQQKFRDRMMKLYGGQCCAVENGVRCTRTTNLQAHHTVPGSDAVGALLCEPHHAAVDPYARVTSR